MRPIDRAAAIWGRWVASAEAVDGTAVGAGYSAYGRDLRVHSSPTHGMIRPVALRADLQPQLRGRYRRRRGLGRLWSHQVRRRGPVRGDAPRARPARRPGHDRRARGVLHRFPRWQQPARSAGRDGRLPPDRRAGAQLATTANHQQMGDLAKAAKAIVDVAETAEQPVRLSSGPTASRARRSGSSTSTPSSSRGCEVAVCTAFDEATA